jgi:peptidoglycan/LPS O-acetylase OafA/YrhL
MTYKEDIIKESRIYFLDNLRTFMIFLVVLLHSGLVYENNVFSAFIWIVYDPATNNLASFLVGFIYSVCMDIFNFQGWTKTVLIDFQNERLLIYLMFFLLGSLCHEQKIFESKPKGKKLYIIIIGNVWMPITLYYFLNVNSVAIKGNYIFSEMVDTLLLWFNFHLSLLCLLYILIYTFRVYLDRQGNISKELNKNSYPVYIIHMIVMGGLALTMMNAPIPSILKYLILTCSTFVVSNLIIYFYRNVGRSKILIKRMKTKMA